MEQELTNHLNKKIIEQFMDTHNDIRTKIDALNRLKENTKLDDDLTSRMNKTINDLNVACIKLEDQINIMNEKAKKEYNLGKRLFLGLPIDNEEFKKMSLIRNKIS